MKCNTCDQNKTATINGRVFCENCGKQAAERLRRFNTEPGISRLHTGPAAAANPTVISKPEGNGHGNVLDLSQYNHVPAEKPSDGPSDSKVYFGGDITQTKPEPQTGATQDVQNPAHTPPNTSQPAASAPINALAHEAQDTTQATPMQPHQTYSLKEAGLNSHADQPHELEATGEDLSALMQNSAINEPEPVKGMPKQQRNWLSRLRGSKLTHIGAVGLSVALLIGYISYLNYPDIAVRVAANNAGVDASMPGYTPEGYKFNGPVAYGSGELVISFASDSGELRVVQSQTDWDSSTLLSSYVRQQTANYETYRDSGLTVYTYGQGNAAWVNNGKLFLIESDNVIESNEILQIAGSL